MDDSGAVVINGRVTKWLIGILTTLVTIIIASMVGIILSYQDQIDVLAHRIAVLERFQERTEANRFTSADGARLYDRMVQYHQDNTPPREVSILLVQYDERLDRLEARLGGDQ